MKKNIFIASLILIICAQQFAKMETLKEDSISIYTQNDIYHILPNSNTIQSETGQSFHFGNRKTMSEFIEKKTSELVEMATNTNYEQAKKFIGEEIEDFGLSTDTEVQEAINKAISVYNLNEEEVNLIEEYFFI